MCEGINRKRLHLLKSKMQKSMVVMETAVVMMVMMMMMMMTMMMMVVVVERLRLCGHVMHSHACLFFQ